jgi:molecular chaperone GrpE
MERDREEDRLRTAGGILREIIPALDNLDRALAQPAETPGFREGVALIRRQLGESLKKLGMEPIEALGEPFDPAFHEAVAAEPRAGFASNTIIEEIGKGYVYAGRVLRPSLVKVVLQRPAGSSRGSTAAPAGEDTSQGGSVGPDHRD